MERDGMICNMQTERGGEGEKDKSPTSEYLVFHIFTPLLPLL
jgi:hypothetical protein